jgi:ubiquinone/menaquinone biosynthesis C-methylase UbiE
VGFYSCFIFPCVCDFLLNNPFVIERRRQLLDGARGETLEIGLGTGLNLPHYPKSIRKITAVDPNPGMHRVAQRRIKQTGIDLDHRQVSGEQLPFEDNSFDCVVSTFTLCSIQRVEQALREVHRVLRPGSPFLFLEHGLSPEPSVQRWQRRLDWLEQRLADGCHLDRNIQELVAAQPFSSVSANKSYLERTPKTHGYLYQGTATK